MPGLYRNSLSKIVDVYFAGVTAQEFTYGAVVHKPKHIHVSPHIFRGTTCPMSCGGCCFNFSLVWLPGDPKPYDENLRTVQETVNGVERTVFVDQQLSNSGHFCRHLEKRTGRCGIHGEHPFTCDFELVRFTHREGRVDIATRLFGRGWSYTRTTGQKGALCDLLPATPRHAAEAARKLRRLKEWSDYFNLVTRLPEIITWVESGPHEGALDLVPHNVGSSISLLDRIPKSGESDG